MLRGLQPYVFRERARIVPSRAREENSAPCGQGGRHAYASGSDETVQEAHGSDISDHHEHGMLEGTWPGRGAHITERHSCQLTRDPRAPCQHTVEHCAA